MLTHRHHTVLRVCAALLLLCAGLLGLATPASHAQSALQVKAAFLPKFAGFVTWPTNAFAEPDDPLVIGVLGTHPFGSDYATSLAGVTIRGRRVELREFESPSDTTNCHLLFLPGAAKHHGAEVIAALRGKPVLTVADFDSFAADGGIMNFMVSAGKVRFEINREAAQDAGLGLDARLLAVSKIVEPARRTVHGKGGRL